MSTVSRLSVMAFAIVSTLLVSDRAALAQVDAATPENSSSGCILRQGGSARFLQGLPDKETVAKTVADTVRAPGARLADPCLSGQTRDLPAVVYAALAAKHPDKFRPLEANVPSPGSPAQAKSAAAGKVPQYHYVSLDDAVPADILFFVPTAMTNGGRVYGEAYSIDADGALATYVAVFENDTVTVYQEGFAEVANQGGTAAGWVLTDPDNFLGQAALFRDGQTTLIPRLPGEIHSQVIALNDPGVALVVSYDQDFADTVYLYDGSQHPPLDFGPEIGPTMGLKMNNKGIISGTTYVSGSGFRGFRFDPTTAVSTLLQPLPSESHSWAWGINNRGEILGYSFNFNSTERIGLWDKTGNFQTYFVEGTPEFPTISNSLVFNDDDLIVITSVSNPAIERYNSYLVPRPGVRLNLANLVSDMPADQGSFYRVKDMNNKGDMFGYTLTPDFFSYDFLLQRTGAGHQ